MPVLPVAALSKQATNQGPVLRALLRYVPVAFLFRRSARHWLRLGLSRGGAGGDERNVFSIWNRSPGTRKPRGKHPLDGEIFLNTNKEQRTKQLSGLLYQQLWATKLCPTPVPLPLCTCAFQRNFLRTSTIIRTKMPPYSSWVPLPLLASRSINL